MVFEMVGGRDGWGMVGGMKKKKWLVMVGLKN